MKADMLMNRGGQAEERRAERLTVSNPVKTNLPLAAEGEHFISFKRRVWVF